MLDYPFDDDFSDVRGITPRTIRRIQVFSESRGELELENTEYFIRSQNDSFKTKEEYTSQVIKEEVIGYVEVTKGYGIGSPNGFYDLFTTLIDLLDKSLVRRMVLLDSRLTDSELEIIDEEDDFNE